MDSTPLRVCIVTFGCQMNRLDSRLLKGRLDEAGYDLCESPEGADAVLYNTCSVREHAENRVFSHLGSYRNRAEDEDGFVLGVIGCMAQRLGDHIRQRFPFVDLVCGTHAFLRVPEYLRAILAGEGPVVDLEGEGRVEFQRDPCMRRSHHSAFVSVMRGCDNYCAYCIVPYVRGREVSRPLPDVMQEVRTLAADGVREVTFLGQNVNSYGAGLEKPVDLADLLEEADEVEGLERIRFVTSQSKDMTERILAAVGERDKVCEHLHLPAQSGSDPVLARMNRGYAAADYRNVVARARELIPGVELASDFIVGFPGETDEDFRRTLALLEEVRFQQSFMFKYSPRPGTAAARLEDDVPAEVKKERHRILLEAQERVDLERRAALVGREVEVLVDGVSKKDSSNLSGRTRRNDIVVFKGPESLAGRLRRVRITDHTALTLFGKLPG